MLDRGIYDIPLGGTNAIPRGEEGSKLLFDNTRGC